MECDAIDRVIVSTNSEKIANIAKEWGAEVPFLRPDSLSQDETATEPALLHVLDELEAEGYIPDAVMLLQPTSPIRKPGSLQRAIEQYESDRADSLLSVCPSHNFIWQNPDSPIASYDYKNRPRRQDIPKDQKSFRESGSVYITDTKMLRMHNNRLAGKISMFVMDEEEGHDIDVLTDFVIAEAIIKEVNFDATMNSISLSDIDAIIFDFDGVLTNNLVHVEQDGSETVTCNRGDGLGFEILRDLQIPMFIISREKNPVVTARANKIKVPVFQEIRDKAGALHSLCDEHGFKLDRIMFVGNDVNDIPAMDLVGYPIAVNDAHNDVKAIACKVLSQPGGGAVVREILESVLDISPLDWVRGKTYLNKL